MLVQDWTAMKGMTVQGCQNRNARIKRPGWDIKESTARKGQLEQDSQNGTSRRGQAEQDWQNSRGRTGQA